MPINNEIIFIKFFPKTTYTHDTFFLAYFWTLSVRTMLQFILVPEKKMVRKITQSSTHKHFDHPNSISYKQDTYIHGTFHLAHRVTDTHRSNDPLINYFPAAGAALSRITNKQKTKNQKRQTKLTKKNDLIKKIPA